MTWRGPGPNSIDVAEMERDAAKDRETISDRRDDRTGTDEWVTAVYATGRNHHCPTMERVHRRGSYIPRVVRSFVCEHCGREGCYGRLCHLEPGDTRVGGPHGMDRDAPKKGPRAKRSGTLAVRVQRRDLDGGR